MMKIYWYGGAFRQYEEGKQPEGAVEATKPTTKEKAKKTTNKAKKPANKSKKVETK